MNKEKFLIWYVIITSVLGVATFGYYAFQSNSNISILLIFLPLLGLISSLYMLKNKRWAYLVAIGFFAVQVPVIRTGSFKYFLFSGLEFHIDFSADNLVLGVNILALAMLILAYKCYRGSQINMVQ